MCNRYVTPALAEIERSWHLGPTNQLPLFARQVFPRALIPWFAKEVKLKFLTNNACSEELNEKMSYKDPWKRGQRCIIPAASFDEPNWETGVMVQS